MEREEKEFAEEENSNTQPHADSTTATSDKKHTADDDVVKDENIPVVYIDTTPNKQKE